MPRKRNIETPNPQTQAEKLSVVKNLMREQNKKYGNVVLHFGKDEESWERIPTNIPMIDELIGNGFPCGRFSVVWGGEGSGKSTLMYYIVAQAQKLGKVVAFIDLENSFEKERAIQFGIDLEKLVLGHFPVAEESLDAIIQFVKNKAVDVIIVDSVHSLSPEGEQHEKSGKEKSTKDDTMALLARKLSQFFRMASTYVYRANTAVIMIGQTRTNLGGFIALQTLSGGHALKHNSVLTLHMRRGTKSEAPTEIETVIDDEGKKHKHKKIIGFDCVIKIDKTQTPKTKVEGTEIHIPFYFEGGFNKKQPPKVEINGKPLDKVISVKINKTVVGYQATKSNDLKKLPQGGSGESTTVRKRGRPKKEK